MYMLKDIPHGCKIEEIGKPYKISSTTMQNVKYSAPNKQLFLKLRKKLEQIKNIYAFMQRSDELDKAIIAQFVIEDQDHINS